MRYMCTLGLKVGVQDSYMTIAIHDTVLTCECDEPEGIVNRSIYPMILTPRALKEFWERARHHNTLFSADVRGDFKTFLELFLHELPSGDIECHGLFWVVDDYIGVYYMTDIKPGVDAQVHYSFFDGRHKGRVNMSRMLLKHAFDEYKFHRLSASIPLYAQPALMFVEKMGFKKEGRKRSFAWHNNQWFDVNLYGILRDEV